MAHPITATRSAIRFAAISFDLALVGASLRDVRQRVTAAIRERVADFAHPYRPELHYMRGPGPKWREKHQAKVVAK
jgi:hypothetical protein